METDKQKHRRVIHTTAKYIKSMIGKGVFVECGVKQGTSSRIMASILQREGYLFDTWRGFPHYSKKDIPPGNARRERRLRRRVKDNSSTYKNCKKALQRHRVLNLCHMIKGDICKTVPKFTLNRSVSICLMHIDTDLHNPALVALNCFLPFMLKNSIILFHDYKDPKWPGITKIVNAFINKHSSWGFIDMNAVVGINMAAIVNGYHLPYLSQIVNAFIEGT